MGEWRQVKIKDIATHRKESIIIQDDLQYKLCRVQLHRKGVVLRELRLGSEIKTKKQQLCKNGDLVVAEMDAKYGGYGFLDEELDGAIVSSHYYLYELDTRKIYRDYFQVLIHSGLIQNQIEAKGSTNYSSIRAWEFLDYSIPLPDLKLQKKIARRFSSFYNFKKNLHLDNDYQFSLFKLLRQAILQEAIEGKLTAGWRKKNQKLISGENHASKLLEKIKAEKERLIKEGKIRKDKSLSPIADDEKKNALPEGWVWCRLGEICFKITDGFHNTPKKISKGIPYIAATHVKSDRIDWEQCHYVSEKDHRELFAKTYPQKGEILLVNIGAGCGTPAIIDVDYEFSFKNTAILKFNQSLIVNTYIFNYFIFKRTAIYTDLTKGGL
ncbi:MAG: restriction endonuclease subunit S [Smithella sp.]|jgi:type I restriction enzyme S subunit